jgi:hypothetical protein
MAMKPTPKPPASARRSKDPVARGLEFFFGDKPTAKPKKKTAPASPKSKQNPSLNKPTPKPKAKKPTLDDFLLKGKRPPVKLKPGLKRPRGL